MSLSIQDLSLSFGDKQIFSQVSFTLAQGEIACLLGHSGCGKTSILRCISGFETPANGRISLQDELLFGDGHSTPAHLRQIGMVFQDYALFPHLTVAENIAFGLHKMPKAAQKQRINELLALINMPNYHDRYPHELSGGQQQRVALARTLAPRPKLILLDEPFSNLDMDLRTSLSADVRRLLKSENVSAILVTHDQTEAFIMADSIGVIADGQLQQWDSPTGLYHRPQTQTVASFIGDGVLLDFTALPSTPAHDADSGNGSDNGIGNGFVQTAFGQVACTNSLVHSPSAKLLIRPEDVAISAQGSDSADTTNTADAAHSSGIITHQKFCGSHWLISLQAADGTLLLAQSPTSLSYQDGQCVNVHIAKGWVV